MRTLQIGRREVKRNRNRGDAAEIKFNYSTFKLSPMPPSENYMRRAGQNFEDLPGENSV